MKFDNHNVYHPLQVAELGTVFRYNPVLKRTEYFSWGQAAWDSIGDVFTPYSENQPRRQWRWLANRSAPSNPIAGMKNGYSMTTYGKTYLEPIVES